ncbi:hypothetical protein B0H14DRAFT_3025063 [Mycena olivaceomarginata]|nr:hypothetical protein B0H14DRAFT_3025063 [Mycena olivaceomarginata]
MTGKEQTKPSNFWEKLRGKLKGSPNTMEELTNVSRGMAGSQIHIGAVYGGIGGSGGPGAYGGAGGTGQGPNFFGVMHVNKLYGASRQAHTMLLPWFAPKALFNANTRNTRVGLISHLKQWANSTESSPIFWLSGMAGTGKSTVAYTLCECWLREHRLGAVIRTAVSVSKCI